MLGVFSFSLAQSGAVWADVGRSVAAATQRDFEIARRTSVSGGSINSAWKISGSGASYFVKLNAPARLSMFSAEAEGLEALARTRTVKVPAPICHGSNAAASWLVLEHLPLRRRTPESDARLGEALAALHRMTGPGFGWHADNTIGATPQPNACDGDWVAFWRDQRLGFQLELARGNGYTGALQTQGEKLRARLDEFFRGYTPAPSLLHGDLWSGNAASDEAHAPVIFDPAVYYGDREADVAMTELFGGFAPEFYSAYRAAHPLDEGYAARKTLYNLYHVLNHLNLFGGRYREQAEKMIASLLAELG